MSKLRERWHALYVFTGQEDKVKKALNTIFADDMVCIVPRRTLRERKSGKWETVRRTLFPGYVLVKGNMGVEEYYRIKQIPIFASLLRDESGPLEVVESEMQLLQHLLKDRKEDIEISTAFREGEKIKIVEGPLLGLEGRIQRVDPRKGRATVNIDFLKTAKTVQLGIHFIDKI